MGTLANLEIRQKLCNKNVTCRQLARHMNIHHVTLSRWLASEMPEQKKKLIMTALNEM